MKKPIKQLLVAETILYNRVIESGENFCGLLSGPRGSSVRHGVLHQPCSFWFVIVPVVRLHETNMIACNFTFACKNEQKLRSYWRPVCIVLMAAVMEYSTLQHILRSNKRQIGVLCSVCVIQSCVLVFSLEILASLVFISVEFSHVAGRHFLIFIHNRILLAFRWMSFVLQNS